MIRQFLGRDTIKALRVIEQEYEPIANGYIIRRWKYVVGGKKLKNSNILITSGTEGRNVQQELVYVLGQLYQDAINRGYKLLKKPIEQYSLEEINKLFSKNNVNNIDNIKPMLFKPSYLVKEKHMFDREYYISPNFFGVRCILRYQDNHIVSICKYDTQAISYIINNEKLILFFKKHPDLVMDGEIYLHGYTRDEIIDFLENNNEEIKLEYYWYDIIDTSKTFKQRRKKILTYSRTLCLKFGLYKAWRTDSLRIQPVPHEVVYGWKTILEKHNMLLGEGWEGAIIRLGSGYYGFDKCSDDAILIQEYDKVPCKMLNIIQEWPFDYSNAIIICRKPFGPGRFKARILGSRAFKKKIFMKFKKKYRWHMADVNYFQHTEHGIKEKPCLIRFRFDLDK